MIRLRINLYYKFIMIFCTLTYSLCIYILIVFEPKCETIKTLESNSLNAKINGKITIVMIEFEYFHNDLIETINSFCNVNYGDAINILIISDKSFYPPIDLKSISHDNCNVSHVITECDPRKPLKHSHPESFITTEYVFIIPDSLRLLSHTIFNELIKYIEMGKDNAIVVPIESDEKINCIKLDVELRHWTLSYYYNGESKECDSFDKNAAIFVRRNDLLKLNRPFNRPFLESFYIQNKLHDIKVQLMKSVSLSKGTELFVNNSRNKWKHELWDNERRKKLYSDFGIKKVIDLRGHTHWYGCTKTTQRCFGTVINDMPEYLYNGRWTPECCLENLRKTARHVFKTLEELGVRYWLEGGSLLGAARHGDIIPWDYDVDIGIYRDDIQKCQFLVMASQNNHVIDNDGFVWERASEGDFFRVQFSITNRLHVDIFPFYSRGGIMTKDTWFNDHPQDREFPEHYLQPLIKIKFADWNANAPNNVVEFLEFKFGSGVIENPQYPVPHLLEFPRD